jgi:hypothetical protein
MNENDNDDRDILSDSHRSYIVRYIERENLRQQQVSKLFLASRLSLRGRACPAQSKTFKAS